MACTGLEADIKFIASLCQSCPNSVSTVLITRSNPQGGLLSLLNLRESHKGHFGAQELYLLPIFSTLLCCLSPKHLPELGVSGIKLLLDGALENQCTLVNTGNLLTQ